MSQIKFKAHSFTGTYSSHNPIYLYYQYYCSDCGARFFIDKFISGLTRIDKVYSSCTCGVELDE